MLLWFGLVCYFLQVSSHSIMPTPATRQYGNGQMIQDWTFLWWKSIARKTAQTRYMLSIEWLNIWCGVYQTQQINLSEYISKAEKGKKRRRSLGNSTIADPDVDVCPIVPAAGFPLVFGSRSCCAQHIMQLIYNAIQLETSNCRLMFARYTLYCFHSSRGHIKKRCLDWHCHGNADGRLHAQVCCDIKITYKVVGGWS